MRRIGLLLVLALAFLPFLAQAQSPMKLSCSLGQESIIVDPDETKSTVNSIRADFTKDMIIWGYNEPSVGSSTSYYLNRYTGDIKRQITRGNDLTGTFTYGKCQKVSERQF